MAKPSDPGPSNSGPPNSGPSNSGPSSPGQAGVRALAVALRQTPAERAPRVIAKGEGGVAEQILAVAFEHGVKVRSDPDLAEILRAVEVDSEVPLEALAAVAEILSYVYRVGRDSPPETSP